MLQKKRIAGGLSAIILAAAVMTAAGTFTAEEAAVDSEALTEEAQTQAPEEESEISGHGIRFAGDYKEVYQALKSAWYGKYDLLDYAVEEDAEYAPAFGASEAKAESAAADTGTFNAVDTADTDFSQTNLRDAGVDEADIVKTDGQWIYILRDEGELVIIQASGADLSICSRTNIRSGEGISSGTAADMYVDHDRLCVVCREYDNFSDDYDDDYYDYRWNSFGKAFTALYVYDITDREFPVFAGSAVQDGYYRESRKMGDTVYLYSEHSPDMEDTYEESSIIPKVNGEELPAGDVCIPEVVTDSRYLIVTSINLENPEKIMDAKALVSGASQCYVSTNGLYVMNEDYSGSSQRTEIVKFDCKEGRIEGRGACYLKGYVNNTFSIDEYKGNLRVLTTYTGSEYGEILEALGELFGVYYYDSQRWVRHNALYILDEDLNKISSLKGIAENEEIRSARYFGDTVYFVTFENTDPLFTADLSDPAAPRLTGELKITGFSSYLHPYGEGKLLGIGYEADEETGSVTGLKLSMFDVSDPSAVTEEARFVMSGITWCPAIEDYKSILVNGEKNLIGFFCDDRYMAFSYDREGKSFSRVLLYDFYEDMLSAQADYNEMRGLYIGDEMYLAGEQYVIAFNMADDFTKENILTWE